MVDGICVDTYTVQFRHVVSTQVIEGLDLEIGTVRGFIILHGDDAERFQKEFRKWLGIPSVDDKPVPNGWYGAI